MLRLRFQGIGPVVIRQILESSPDGVKIFNFGFSMIKVVAFLRQIEETSTRIIYKLEDHTGQIDAHLWLDETSREKSDPRLKVNRYVSIVGSVRNNNGTKAIMLFKIAPVDGVNEVNTHLLEVLNTRYSAEDFSRKSNGLDVGQEPSTTSASSDNCGLTGKPLQVFKLIKENQSCEGISLQDLYKKLPKFSQQEIMYAFRYS